MLFFAFILAACEKEEPAADVPSGKLLLLSPEGGEFKGEGEISASGKAVNVDAVTVNGVEASVDAGTFEGKVALERGVNVVEARGVDGTGHTIFVRNGVMSGEYEAAEGDVEDAVYLRVNEGGLTRIGEIATGMLDTQTINASLGAVNPVYSDSYLWDTVVIADDIESVSFDEPSFDFEPRDGALGLTVTIPNLYVDTLAYGTAAGFDFSSDVSMSASSAVLTADLYVSASNGRLSVDIGEVTVDLKDFAYDTSLLPGTIEDYILVDTIRATVEEMLVTQINDMVPPLLDELLTSLDPSYSTELMGLSVDLGFGFSAVDIDDDGIALTLDLDVKIPPTGEHSAPGYLGADLGTPDVDTHADIAGAISDNLLNRMLYEAWAGGLLDITLSTEDGSLSALMLAPLKATEGTIVVTPLLPPVIVEREGELQAQLGELLVDINTPGGALGDHLLASVNAFAKVEVTVEDGELKLELGAPEVVLMVRESSMGAKDEEMTNLVEQAIPFDVLFSLVGDFSFPLPVLYGLEIDEGAANRDDSGVYTGLEVSLK
ncbi:hypothetical protein LBMAG42_08900 [Deltaproteobacteria bacterium]|nr:hypothetical protein LBMAG42_08900 [Deltaproteobacteria bacterium]